MEGDDSFAGYREFLKTNGEEEKANRVLDVYNYDYDLARTINLPRAAREEEPVTPYLVEIMNHTQNFISYLKSMQPMWVLSKLQRGRYGSLHQFHFKIINSLFPRNWINIFVEYTPHAGFQYGVEIYSFEDFSKCLYSSRHAIKDLNRIQNIMFDYLTMSPENQEISIGESKENEVTGIHQLSLEDSSRWPKYVRKTGAHAKYVDFLYAS